MKRRNDTSLEMCGINFPHNMRLHVQCSLNMEYAWKVSTFIMCVDIIWLSHILSRKNTCPMIRANNHDFEFVFDFLFYNKDTFNILHLETCVSYYFWMNRLYTWNDWDLRNSCHGREIKISSEIYQRNILFGLNQRVP